MLIITYEVQLEDLGQDLLSIITDDKGMVLETRPFHTDLYKGALIPIEQQVIGEECMIHNPPHIEYGFLKYKVLSITPIDRSTI